MDRVVQFILKLISRTGEFALFTAFTFYGVRTLPRRFGLFLKQCEFIGVKSMGIVALAAFFMGGVLGYQLYIAFHFFNAEALVGGSIGMALFREIGPVMTAIMVTGQAGAAMSAEIASMRLSEQVDALEVMAVDPYEFLMVPRVFASMIMVPLLSVFFSVVASIAGAYVACNIMGLESTIYWDRYTVVVDTIELLHCTVKGLVFGTILALMGCFYGFRTFGGAKSVGLATRSTVVVTCLLILLSDYILTSLLPYGFERLVAQ